MGIYKPKKKIELGYSVGSLSGPTNEDIKRWEHKQRMEREERERIRRLEEIVEKMEKAEQAMAELEEIIDEMIEYDAPGYEIDRMIRVYHDWEQHYHNLKQYYYDLGGGR